MFLASGVRENVYTLGLPTWFCVTANLRGARTHALKKEKEKKKKKKKKNLIKTFNFLYMDKCPSHRSKNCENVLVLGTLA